MISLLTIPTLMATLWAPTPSNAAAAPMPDDAATAPHETSTADTDAGPPPSLGDTTEGLATDDGDGGDATDETPDGDSADASADDQTQSTGLPPAAKPVPVPTALATRPPPPPPTPRPIRWRLDFGVAFGSTLVSDRGYLAFSDRRHLPEATTSILFDFRLAQSRFFLGGGLAYQRLGRDGGQAYGQLGTELTLHEPEVLGRFSVMTLEGIDVFTRVGVGPSFVQTQYYSSNNANGREVLPRIDGQAGLSLYLPKAWLRRKQASRITAGIELGMGYTWRGTIEAQPVLEQLDEPLRASTSPWGDLSLQGLSWRVGLLVRLM